MFIEFFHIFSSLENAVYSYFRVYFDSNSLEQIMRFSMFESVSLRLAFPQGTKIKILIDYTGHSSTINIKFTCNFLWCRMSSWVKIFSTSSMFYSVRTDLGRPEPSCRATSLVSPIIFYSFFTLFTSSLYSG